MNARLF